MMEIKMRAIKVPQMAPAMAPPEEPVCSVYSKNASFMWAKMGFEN